MSVITAESVISYYCNCITIFFSENSLKIASQVRGIRKNNVTKI